MGDVSYYAITSLNQLNFDDKVPIGEKYLYHFFTYLIMIIIYLELSYKMHSNLQQKFIFLNTDCWI